MARSCGFIPDRFAGVHLWLLSSRSPHTVLPFPPVRIHLFWEQGSLVPADLEQRATYDIFFAGCRRDATLPGTLSLPVLVGFRFWRIYAASRRPRERVNNPFFFYYQQFNLHQAAAVLPPARLRLLKRIGFRSVFLIPGRLAYRSFDDHCPLSLSLSLSLSRGGNPNRRQSGCGLRTLSCTYWPCPRGGASTRK